MNLHFSKNWAVEKFETFPEALGEPYVIGVPQLDSSYMVADDWIAHKINELQQRIEHEMREIRERNQTVGKDMFSGMGNTTTLQYHAQIEVLKELRRAMFKLEE